MKIKEMQKTDHGALKYMTIQTRSAHRSQRLRKLQDDSAPAKDAAAEFASPLRDRKTKATVSAYGNHDHGKR